VEIAALASFLAPLLPYVVQAGQKVAGRAADVIGDEAASYAERLWERLRPGVESKPGAKEAVEDVARSPEDPDALAALRNQLKKLLEEDEALKADLEKIWGEARAANVVTASGERSVAVGGNVSGSQIITGDQVQTDRS
jgi:Ser/Thr protein kinase RdoA (MazF antagonist)